MISNEQIKKIIEDCAKENHKISVRDIAYVLLCMHFDDSMVAYKALFGNDSDYVQEYHNTYDQTLDMNYLRTYMEFQLQGQGNKKLNISDDISFEENKAYMLKLKKDTEEAMAKKEIPKKDGLKILTDISTKLNDKFNVSESAQDQVVYVFEKYNDICPNCGKEISRRPISKEEAKNMYNLEEK